MRNAYWKHIETIITPMQDDQYSGLKRFWGFIKSMRKDHVGVTTLKDNGKVYTDPKEKANLLNRQFESVFTQEDPIPDNLLPKHHTHPTIQDIQFTVPGIQKMLEQLKPHKACGPDEVGPRVLKELATSVAPVLAIIFQKSYDTGEVPRDWKTANVVAVFKKGKKCSANNYRPISLTCVSCKIMEHVVASSIMRHAKRNSNSICTSTRLSRPTLLRNATA